MFVVYCYRTNNCFLCCRYHLVLNRLDSELYQKLFQFFVNYSYPAHTLNLNLYNNYIEPCTHVQTFLYNKIRKSVLCYIIY